MLEEASSPSPSPALEKVSQNGTISPSLPLLFPPRESRRSPALLRQTRCRRSAAFFFLLLFHRRFAAPCRSDVVRRLARSKPHGRHRLLSLPPTVGIARPRPAPLPPLPADPHSAHSARPKSGEGESMPRSDCLPEPGSPLCSLCSPHASAAGDVTAASAPLPPLKLLLLRHIVHSLLLPIHRYRRPQPARPFIDQRSRRCDRRTDEAALRGRGPPFSPSFLPDPNFAHKTATISFVVQLRSARYPREATRD